MSSLGLLFWILSGSLLVLTAAEFHIRHVRPRMFAKVFGFRPLKEGETQPTRYRRRKAITHIRNVGFRIGWHQDRIIFYTNSTLYTLVELLCLEKDMEGYAEKRVELKERLKVLARHALINRWMARRYFREFRRSCKLANLFKYRI